jgi:hypothetical protein
MNQWKMRGVWAVVGATLGIGTFAAFNAQPVSAVATSGGVEGTILATGQSSNQAAEFLWMLDDRGMLTCFLMGLQGRTVTAPSIDVKQAIKGKGGKKGKYAMVTGRFQVQGQISDVLYLTESSSKEVAVFALTNDGIKLVNTLVAPRNQ